MPRKTKKILPTDDDSESLQSGETVKPKKRPVRRRVPRYIVPQVRDHNSDDDNSPKVTIEPKSKVTIEPTPSTSGSRDFLSPKRYRDQFQSPPGTPALYQWKRSADGKWTFNKDLIKYYLTFDSPDYEDLKNKRFNTSFLHETRRGERDIQIFTPEEDDLPMYKLPEVKCKITGVPGVKYVDAFKSIAALTPVVLNAEEIKKFNSDASHSLEGNKGKKVIKGKQKKKETVVPKVRQKRSTVGKVTFKGGPLPDDTLFSFLNGAIDADILHSYHHSLEINENGKLPEENGKLPEENEKLPEENEKLPEENEFAIAKEKQKKLPVKSIKRQKKSPSKIAQKRDTVLNDVLSRNFTGAKNSDSRSSHHSLEMIKTNEYKVPKEKVKQKKRPMKVRGRPKKIQDCEIAVESNSFHDDMSSVNCLANNSYSASSYHSLEMIKSNESEVPKEKAKEKKRPMKVRGKPKKIKGGEITVKSNSFPDDTSSVNCSADNDYSTSSCHSLKMKKIESQSDLDEETAFKNDSILLSLLNSSSSKKSAVPCQVQNNMHIHQHEDIMSKYDVRVMLKRLSPDEMKSCNRKKPKVSAIMKEKKPFLGTKCTLLPGERAIKNRILRVSVPKLAG